MIIAILVIKIYAEFSHVYEGKLQKEVVVERAHISVTKSGPVSVMKREIVK